jgi:hypothetical protein
MVVAVFDVVKLTLTPAKQEFTTQEDIVINGEAEFNEPAPTNGSLYGDIFVNDQLANSILLAQIQSGEQKKSFQIRLKLTQPGTYTIRVYGYTDIVSTQPPPGTPQELPLKTGKFCDGAGNCAAYSTYSDRIEVEPINVEVMLEGYHGKYQSIEDVTTCTPGRKCIFKFKSPPERCEYAIVRFYDVTRQVYVPVGILTGPCVSAYAQPFSDYLAWRLGPTVGTVTIPTCSVSYEYSSIDFTISSTCYTWLYAYEVKDSTRSLLSSLLIHPGGRGGQRWIGGCIEVEVLIDNKYSMIRAYSPECAGNAGVWLAHPLLFGIY